MDSEWDTGLRWAFGIAVALLLVPPLIFWIVGTLRHKARQRMVDGPRKISVVGPGPDGGGHACAHQRSKGRARTAPDGSVTSFCRKCGARMKRLGPGDWTAVEGAP